MTMTSDSAVRAGTFADQEIRIEGREKVSGASRLRR